MKGIKCCAECADYSLKKHKCTRGAKDPGKATDSFYADCPLDDAEPVWHGRWIPTEYDSYADGAPVWDKYECSECGHEHSGEEDTLTAFCPNCGAKMDATDTNVGGKGDEEMDLSPLDFLAAEYDRKHPQGIRFVDCMEGADDGACKKV